MRGGLANDREDGVGAQAAVRVSLCRFNDGRLEKSTFVIDSTKYLAISHVWGKAEWHDVRGFDERLLVSKEKAKFMEEKLCGVVAGEYFWMDILCINQHNDEDRVAIAQHIPMIFQLAQKTIVVRESTGFQECCVEAIGDMDRFFEEGACRSLFAHWDMERLSHCNLEEGVLSRVWPFQEII